jgi:hypothetical protein
MDYEDKLYSIIAWAKTNPKFKCATFIGISENFEIYNRFTENQETAIDNVFYKWKIDQWCISNTVYKHVLTPVTKITNFTLDGNSMTLVGTGLQDNIKTVTFSNVPTKTYLFRQDVDGGTF